MKKTNTKLTKSSTSLKLPSPLKVSTKFMVVACMGTMLSINANALNLSNRSFTHTTIDNLTSTHDSTMSWSTTSLLPSNVKQQTQVTGVVKDEAGFPIPGVNVLVKGSTNGTTTDIDGNYTLTVSSDAKILIFSYLGLKTVEIAITQSGVVNATLKSDAAALDEVVVVGYGTVRKSDVTGSLTSVSTEDINKTQNTSIAQAIQGRAAGVTVSKGSGGPGATPTVRIRGVGTVNNADPLYVVDGVPITDISSVNMADAKSVEVLKDASATAIYGSRGANGVVLITTNSGKKGKTIISYKTFTSSEKRIDNLDVLNSEQWATLYNEANVNDGRAADPFLADPSSLPNYNWKDAVYRTGTLQSHQLAASGGSDKSTFYVGFGYINQTGVVEESSYKRTNFRVNNTYQITPKIKLGNNIQYSVSNTNSVPSYGVNSNAKAAFSGFFIDPVTPFFNEDGSYALPKYAAQPINPFGLTKYGVTPEKKESFLGSVYIDVDIIKDLSFKSNFGLQVNNTSSDNFQPAYYVSPMFSSPVSTYNLSRAERRSIVLSNTLNYNKKINNKHYFTALLGQEIQNSSNNNINASRNSIPTSVGQPTINAGDVSSSTNGGTRAESKLLSFFGRLNYNFDDRYILTGTYRVDGSSRFGSNNRWAKFPSLAAAWNLHKENFFKVDAISQFKVRAGWGETGNQNIPNSAVYNTLNVGTNSIFGKDELTALGIAPLTPGNANLKWETTITTNIGIDMGFFKNAITVTADYFIKNTSDMLLASPILFTSGYANSPYTNAGNIENKGLELSLNYKKTIKDFSFNVGGNISFIRNKVTALASEGSIILTGDGNNFYNISRTQVGHSLASFYGYQMLGIFQNQDEIDSSASLLNTQPGDVKYQDVDGDGEITDNDRKYIGSPFPKFTYGLNLDLAYKQFDFTAFFQGSQGNKIYNTTDYWLEGDLASNSSTTVLGRWTAEGTSNSVPRSTFTNAGINNLQSSRFVKDGSYLRLKNVQLGYTLNKSVLDAINLQNLRVYVAAQNLLTFTKYDGVDPELGVDSSQDSPLDLGIDRGRYPSVRSLSLGLDINF